MLKDDTTTEHCIYGPQYLHILIHLCLVHLCLTRVVLGKYLCPLLPCAGQRMCYTHPLPGKQSLWGHQGEQRGVEHVVCCLSYKQPCSQQIKVIQR